MLTLSSPLLPNALILAISSTSLLHLCFQGPHHATTCARPCLGSSGSEAEHGFFCGLSPSRVAWLCPTAAFSWDITGPALVLPELQGHHPEFGSVSVHHPFNIHLSHMCQGLWTLPYDII